VTSLQERRDDIRSLQGLLGDRGSIRQAAFVLRRNINRSTDNLDELQPGIADYYRERFDEALSVLHEAGLAVKDIILSLDEANSTINSMLNRSVEIEAETDTGRC
jgi:Mg2+ and Co2+ transporter CorA